ncbi:MAG TPA: phosphate ABC transporter substrate-binding protein [Chitinivibrionales bacterium]|nr:phosphate ABC transporter substrate-binding protein [Chitinivibrionales bacterium]
MKHLTKTVLVASLCLVGAVGIIAAAGKKVITVKGSDTMVILAQRWAEEYMAKHPDVTVQVTGGGSGVGLSALINGTTDIADASRPIKNSEVEKIKARFNALSFETKAAKDGITLYLNEANGVSELTIAQIKAIYLGEVTNWKDVGGEDAKIVLYGRENSSGTYVYFRDNVLDGKDYSPTMQSLPGTAAVVNAVAKDKEGIGYGGAAYAKGVKVLKVKKDANSQAYEPTPETIKADQYPITRYLYMYTRARPVGDVKNFIDWTLGDEGQAIVTKVGYFPVK